MDVVGWASVPPRMAKTGCAKCFQMIEGAISVVTDDVASEVWTATSLVKKAKYTNRDANDELEEPTPPPTGEDPVIEIVQVPSRVLHLTACDPANDEVRHAVVELLGAEMLMTTRLGSKTILIPCPWTTALHSDSSVAVEMTQMAWATLREETWEALLTVSRLSKHK